MLFSKKTENKKRNLTGKIFLVIFVLLLIGASFLAGAYYSQKNKVISDFAKNGNVFVGLLSGKYNTDSDGRLSQNIDFNLYWDLWDKLKTDFVDNGQLTEKEMFYGSLRGLADSLKDPYTLFLDPKETKKFSDDLSGTFEGIGAEIGLRDDILTIVAPLSGMPAEKAGLKAGDQIFAINGTSTISLSVDGAVNLIRGPKDTKVTLTIYRQGFKETRDFEIMRDVIYVKSVETEFRADGLYVIKVSNFNEDTAGLFSEAARDILTKNPKGVILDLRNNPGGFLETAVAMSSEWVDNNKVVIEKFGDGHEESYVSEGRARLKDYKTVVLVNGGSASASEIVAGALKDYGLAVIVGEKTYGKGSVQSLENMEDGSTLKITIAKWLTPNGTSINKEGITPDVEIKFTGEDYANNKDPQMDKAIEILLTN
ncbi:MAG: S41 family peptidase [Patescibacteria group bacterium]|jgi:carboxyl-terminal processing protease